MIRVKIGSNVILIPLLLIPLLVLGFLTIGPQLTLVVWLFLWVASEALAATLR